MPSDCISYQDSGYFSPLVVDYLNQKDTLKALYHRFPTLENFKLQAEEKQQNYPPQFRNTLTDALTGQYNSLEPYIITKQNIELLRQESTFTVTTGHQLNLFTGPLYFLYKIVSTINLAKELKAAYPEYNFVPIYWMATEDHDFEEINYFNFRDKKIKWPRESTGPVGRLSNEGIDAVLKAFAAALGPGTNAKWLSELFETAYLKHNNLADATRYLANKLFGKQGLVIIDGDDASLKKLFAPYVQEELLSQSSHQKVAQTATLLKDYNIQVNPRDINLFYIEDALRERIVFEDGVFKVNNTDIQFSKEQIIAETGAHPEKFSPNVIMRPLYQEVILPNLCYIGGGGELAYWLELKAFFAYTGVTFPILLLRNSVLLATQKQTEKLDKLGLTWVDVFLKQQDLLNKKVQDYSEHSLDFTEQKAFLSDQFRKLAEVAARTDASFSGAVKAQELKQLKGLENLEKRLLKAEKRHHSEALARIATLQNELFPNRSLQERRANFAEFYLEYDGRLIEALFTQLQPLKQEFNVVVL